MSKEKYPDAKQEVSVQPEKVVAPPVDSFMGRGGRYIRNPKTGVRERVQYTKRCTDCTASKKE